MSNAPNTVTGAKEVRDMDLLDSVNVPPTLAGCRPEALHSPL
jgi:hypothetical protein